MAGMELTEDALRTYLLACGGKSTNHDLVTHFKPCLSDPEKKVKNREKFKEIVNTLCNVKMGDDDVKYLILKKKFRGSSLMTGSNLSLNSILGSNASLSEFLGASPVTSPAPPSDGATSTNNSNPPAADSSAVPHRPQSTSSVDTPASSDTADNQSTSNCPSSTTDSSAASQSNHRAKSEPPSVQQPPVSPMEINIEVPSQPATDDGMSKFKSESSLRHSKITAFRDSNSTISSSSLASTASEEEIIDATSAITSVKDRAKHLNKLQSESDLQKLASRKYDKSKHEKGKDGSEHDDDSAPAEVSLTPEQKEWMVTASTGDYQAISKLLSKNPQLAKERTALHWAAKHGKPDVVKLLCGKPGINVDQKTGFTPLHLASMHGHDDVIELLILTYKANPNLRDHSGKKPKQYLSSSASAKCQLLIGRSSENQEKILQTRTNSEKPSDEFERSEAIRKSKRVAAIGNLINSSNIMKAQPIVRSSWGGSCEDLYFDRGSGFSSRSQSPSSSRETSPQLPKKELGATSLMPPPTAPARKKKKKRAKTMYTSKENLEFDFPVMPIRKDDSDNSIDNLQVPSSSFV